MLDAPIRSLVGQWGQVQTTRGAVDRVTNVVGACTPESRGGVALASARPLLKCKGVFAAYGERMVLQDVTFEVCAGQRIGIVGGSGSGKTTLAKLLVRLLDPYSGAIWLGDAILADLDPCEVRRRIGAVFADSKLFNVSVTENIAMGAGDVSEQEVMRAAALTGAHDFIMKMPEGYETRIVDGGANLSQGQRQRLAIARALIRRPDILILDEATSGLDSATEAAVKVGIREAMNGGAIIQIAHRLATVTDCDSILVLRDGQIVERGKHGELLTSPEYVRLYQGQSWLSP
jgi:ATP-binding cassette subfamily B protein RtxB